MGSPSDHPGQAFCSTCPSGGAWKDLHHFYTRRPGRSPVRKDHCDSCRQASQLAQLIQACADHFAISPSDIKLPTRGLQDVARARQAVMYLLHERCGWSTYKIARELERDRRSVAHGINRAGEFLTEQKIKAILSTITKRAA